MDHLSAALENAIEGQMKRGETTFIEVVLNQELGEPFRRDAMKKPVSVAGIDRERHAPATGCSLSL
jgi:sulfoacetaldehyde acetyltransferase